MTVQPDLPRPRNWVERNWKWAAPAGCLFILLCMAAFAVLIISLIHAGMTSSQPYKDGVARATSSAAVQNVLGAPVKPGWFMRGNISVDNDRGTCDISIPVSGPKGEGSVRVVGEKASGRWYYSELSVTADGGAAIDLLTPDEHGNASR